MENPILRLLYAKEMAHKLVEHKAAAHSCEEVSKARSIAIGDILKCILLVDGARDYYLACLPGDRRLDLEKTRAFIDTSRLSFATKEEIEGVTGYRVGTVNPFFHNIKLPIIFDNSIREKTIVDVSSGSPNAGVQIHQHLLVMLLNPKFADILETPLAGDKKP